MSSSSESESERRQPKIKKIRSEKMFKTYWLDDPAFKKWLLPDITSKYRARCKICNATLNSGKSELLKHAATKKHINKMKTVKGSKSIDQMFNKDDTHETNVKKAEIKLAAFFAANNVAFHLIDQLEPVLKEIFPDSKICQDMSLKQTKCTEIIRNVLCKKETEDLVSDLKKTNFSILIDESTDIGNSKSLAVLARYSKLGQIKTRLLELIQLDARDLGATHLYAALKSCFEGHGIPLKNIVGVACDGASVMVGKNHSVFHLPQNDISHVILLRCICHSAALVASHACTFLPRSTEELLRGVYNYSSGSAKRSAQLQEMQIFFNDKKSKILKLSTTRWLSRYDCVCRVLENWIALENYFTIAVQEDKLKSAEFILNNLKNPFIKAYLFFMKYVLNFFNRFNMLFQSRKPLIHILYSECMLLMKQLCRNYIQPEILANKDLKIVNLKNPRIFLPSDDIYLGPECTDILSSLSSDGRDIFYSNCLKFYVEAASDLQKRLPDELMKNMGFLAPSVALSNDIKERSINFEELIYKFKDIIDINRSDLENEWRSFSDYFSHAEVEKLKIMEIDEFWVEISKKKRFDETHIFPNLSKLVNIIIILPHSNAEAERIFSIISDTKTRKRNRLAEKSLNSICVVRSSLQASGIDISKYEITQDHLRLHNSRMYSFKSL